MSTRLVYAVGRYPRAGFDDALWAMSYGTRRVEHDAGRESWAELAAFAQQRAERTRQGHPYERGPLVVYVWAARPEEDYAAAMIPPGAAEFVFRPGDSRPARGSAPVGFHTPRP